MSLRGLISERELTHGDFAKTARVAQKLRNFFREQRQPDALSFEQWEALDGIAVKLARILSGDASFRDHWVDIAGYADLGAGQLTPPDRP
jgi:hypothetical protein